ncbi:metal-dependent hydrolase [Propioniciclava sp. MC1683]|jgi:uncharacterized membrane protein|uniref:metal-dependent hydrolase n=1 Tax=Propioniciclava sp. MC1683 TaxID=2760309 RepID=UPI0016031CE4|nr:metal-dependent hydrolase [Propioniciclava sp. MC1683]MBB1501625.1 metal-dependent hydrolase [Propioniciclava sp. MC1683]
MLGYTHVTMGAAAGVATLPFLGAQSTELQVGWVAAFAGSALLADLDHPGAMASRMWGPVSGLLSQLISGLSGGHRWGTHDVVLAGLIAGGLGWAASWSPALATAALAVCVGLALRGLIGLGGGLVLGLVNLAASWWAAIQLVGSPYAGAVLELLPFILVGGILVHAAGDLLTPEGIPVPVLWLRDRAARMSIPVVRTGSLLEQTVVAPAFTLLFFGLAWFQLGSPDLAELAPLLRSLIPIL